MITSSRRFTDDQKLEILYQADESGVAAVLRGTGFYSVFAGGDKNFTTRQHK
jgi:hypothetical protein